MSKEQQQYQKLVMTPVEQLIPRLAVPTILSMMITMIYNLVDAFFVGKLGTSASAAIGVVLGVQCIRIHDGARRGEPDQHQIGRGR